LQSKQKFRPLQAVIAAKQDVTRAGLASRKPKNDPYSFFCADKKKSKISNSQTLIDKYETYFVFGTI
jgi:hypothetical protein